LGYYTWIDLFDVRVRPEHVARVERAIKGRQRRLSEIRYMLDHLRITSNGMLRWFGDSLGKWYRDNEFVDWLKPYCTSGFVVLRSGEGDGAAWAYEFDGNGNAFPCSPRRPAAIMGVLRKNPRWRRQERAEQTADLQAFERFLQEKFGR
jgi:hypothetical protein